MAGFDLTKVKSFFEIKSQVFFANDTPPYITCLFLYNYYYCDCDCYCDCDYLQSLIKINN